jgi:putative Mg2+ transporter-C (MgtC) family protein
MYLNPEDIYKLLLALALGGLIGMERELRDKAAGFRTLMFISAGSALFTIFSARLAAGSSDPTRIAAQIVTGVGFLGAGVILRENGEIRGLTTAATIWLTAAVGVGVGGGLMLYSTLATLIILLVLWFFPALERLMGKRTSQLIVYQVTAPASLEKYAALQQRFQQHRLRIISARRVRRGEDMVCTWTVAGLQRDHDAVTGELFEDPEIKVFEV